MNEQSSRSHFVFTLKIFGSNEVGLFSHIWVQDEWCETMQTCQANSYRLVVYCNIYACHIYQESLVFSKFLHIRWTWILRTESICYLQANKYKHRIVYCKIYACHIDQESLVFSKFLHIKWTWILRTEIICYLQSTGQQVQGVLNLIDLAGSERLAKSGSTGDRLKETQVSISAWKVWLLGIGSCHRF
jgi:hypothetical protein